MNHTATPEASYTTEPALFMAIELSGKNWRLAFSAGGDRPRQTVIPAWAKAAFGRQLEAARKRFGLAENTKVYCCYEAGRDGFSVHRWLEEQGVVNFVIDAASMKVDRKKRRAKTDKIDVRQLLGDLLRYLRGERDVWNVVRVPSAEEEDQRRLHREEERLKKERTQHRARIRSLLATQGTRPSEALNRFLAKLDAARIWDGSPLPAELRGEIEREWERLRLVEAQLDRLEKEKSKRFKAKEKSAAVEKAARLEKLKGIGMDSAWLLVMEMFGWREFNNRKEVGGAAGLGGTPYDSGGSSHEQGISKAGNRRVRARMVELAWLWLRHQPQSELTRWYRRRFAGGGPRMRRVGIVGVARRLLIELWHFAEHGVVPRGAVLKP